MSFVNDAELQNLDLSAFLDDAVDVEDIENFVNKNATGAKQLLSLNQNRETIFDKRTMYLNVKNKDYEAICNQVSEHKWPPFASISYMTKQLFGVVIENANDISEIKVLFSDFAESDKMAYIEDSVIINYFLRILKENSIELVFEAAKDMRDVFMLSPYSTVKNKAQASRMSAESDLVVKQFFQTACECKCDEKQMAELFDVFKDLEYIHDTSIYYNVLIESLLSQHELEKALKLRSQESKQFLKATSFHIFVKYLLQNHSSTNEKHFKKIFNNQNKFSNPMSSFGEIIVSLLELGKINEAESLAEKASLSAMSFVQTIDRINDLKVIELLSKIVDDYIIGEKYAQLKEKVKIREGDFMNIDYILQDFVKPLNKKSNTLKSDEKLKKYKIKQDHLDSLASKIERKWRALALDDAESIERLKKWLSKNEFDVKY
uniref:COP9 signalosome complex subunit 4 n=1 Tax=Rhabditophanes sp. KR3021 TaxID=114890 RepID=A0AC35UHK1_9BILA